MDDTRQKRLDEMLSEAQAVVSGGGGGGGGGGECIAVENLLHAFIRCGVWW